MGWLKPNREKARERASGSIQGNGAYDPPSTAGLNAVRKPHEMGLGLGVKSR